MDIKEKTVALIDALKTICRSYGLGNDGNEYKIITQVFLYKFLNDKFGCALQHLGLVAGAESREEQYAAMPQEKRAELLKLLPKEIPQLTPEQLVSALWKRREEADFDRIFDEVMIGIAVNNRELFSSQTAQGTQIPLFEKLCPFVTDESRRADFARAVVDKLVHFSFDEAFDRSYDFFADIFEYLIKDYNTSCGGKYAEYYTPHAVADIMARLLVGENPVPCNAECCDPSAGTGTLLMALWHRLEAAGAGECHIYAQDISQRSSKMLKLNLILNGLSGELDHAVQGDTLLCPYHKSDDGKELRRFDFVVSNPPFKMDFSDIRDELAAMSVRFRAGVPKIPAKKKDGMAVYTCFLQHVINSLKSTGKAAVVVPTGFLSAKSGVENAILRHITDERLVYGAVSMPPNLFATTGTNVSVLFLDNSRKSDKVILIDASGMGEEYRDSGFQRRRLREDEAERIVGTFLRRERVEDFSAVVGYEEIRGKNYSLSAGQYFGVKLGGYRYDPQQLAAEAAECTSELRALFAEGDRLQQEILEILDKLNISH